ncbi:FtsK/SpoIIIE domain-containing protein [Agromyces aurantiacus]|uniref:FtsK/SpoIIIE domain-containing protein n=1 Tax=Agromyces aurantiacus TaxID=165814 RepID=A0ABV9R765_9MICO|nr:FtsK/SpoIIIE domain-containing protein [Agromyces aurantiacus]MBM7504314.1 S-DNA-T family DNA segregation ATPase FtsK/SpoIIIE [Agromyces aurantiacus]
MPEPVVAAGSPPLTLPPSPPEPARPGFPWIASIAPVAGAVVVWAVTGSAFALLFAALGPLVAIATMLDARRHGARARRAALAARSDALERLRAQVVDRHGLEREAAWRSTPSAREAILRAVPAWRHPVPRRVVVGRGTRPSGLRIDGVATDEHDAAVLREAARLDDAPVAVEAGEGIGFVGPAHLARAAARAAVVQCADAAAPGSLAVLLPATGWECLAALPHRSDDAGASTAVLAVVEADPAREVGGRAASASPPAGAIVIAVAGHPGALPPGPSAIVRVDGPRSGALHPAGGAHVELRPELLSAAEAATWAEGLDRAARRAGLASPERELPERVALESLEAEPPAERPDRSGLRVAVGECGQGRFELDLAAGPHALVAGTTGSGKSEFLLAWMTALALAYGPERVAFLLVDFKGGAAFEPIAALRHVTGIVTDLDEHEAARAVASIRAELRRREHVLRAAGARDVSVLDDGIELPRLVVVVDEFQAMVERFPELGDVIGDVAARGRSLGVHLVLASQRPNGVVREQVTANCGIRISLRVLQRADSLAVVGTDGASRIPPGRPGRAVGDRGDGCPVTFQSALAGAAVIEEARRRHAGASPPRRPWLDPLPRMVGLDSLEEVLAHGRRRATPSIPPVASSVGASAGAWHGGLALGVADDPDRQRRVRAEWHPGHDGPLAVLGAPGSGRSALLEALAAQVAAVAGDDAVLRLEGPRSRRWDAISSLRDAAGPSRRPALVVIDDLDTAFSSWPDEHRFAALAGLEHLLRSSRGTGVAVVASAARLAGLGAGLRDAFTATALLRHASRADLIHAGGAGELWHAEAPAGAGQWRGLRTQFLHAAPAARDHGDGPAPLDLAGHPLVAVASATPAADAAVLSSRWPAATLVRLGSTPDAAAEASAAIDASRVGGPQRILVGDADAWAANWSLTAAARSAATIVVHGGTAEFRALARGTGLPPLLDDHSAQCWIGRPEDPVARRRWLAADSTDSVRQAP